MINNLCHLGAGTFPRHSNVFDSVGKQDHMHSSERDRGDVDKGNVLWRADWGIKQWIPFLLGNKLILNNYDDNNNNNNNNCSY